VDFGEELERRARDAEMILEAAAKHGVPVEMLWKPSGSVALGEDAEAPIRPPLRRPMFVLKTKQYGDALLWAQGLSDQAFVARCDELFVEQRLPFLELLSFARDGAADHEFKALITYLSILQKLAKEHFPAAAVPIEQDEFASAIKRAYNSFHSIESDDPAHANRLVQAWIETTMQRGEEVVWAGCIMTLQDGNIMASPFYDGMVPTIYAVADCYSRRLMACSRQG
jgi:hypothetical protein